MLCIFQIRDRDEGREHKLAHGKVHQGRHDKNQNRKKRKMQRIYICLQKRLVFLVRPSASQVNPLPAFDKERENDENEKGHRRFCRQKRIHRDRDRDELRGGEAFQHNADCLIGHREYGKQPENDKLFPLKMLLRTRVQKINEERAKKKVKERVKSDTWPVYPAAEKCGRLQPRLSRERDTRPRP